MAVVQKTPEDHANEKKHDPVVVPCDCKAKDIHPSCGCPEQQGSSEAVSSATGSSAAKGATGTVTVTTTTKCGCCGVETCTCCTEKKEYVKPKMVESLGSKCGCLGQPTCGCGSTTVVTEKKAVDEKTLEKLEDVAVGSKKDVEKFVSEDGKKEEEEERRKKKKKEEEEEEEEEEKKEEKKERRKK